jgi:anti-sigma B factor antagonist
MFEIYRDDVGVIHLKGMFVAGKSKTAEEILDGVNENVVLDFSGLKYISSSGLGLLVKVQRRLEDSGAKIKIINSSDHIRELFSVTRFDLIFDIE